MIVEALVPFLEGAQGFHVDAFAHPLFSSLSLLALDGL